VLLYALVALLVVGCLAGGCSVVVSVIDALVALLVAGCWLWLLGCSRL
jgi:hypothetical protein